MPEPSLFKINVIFKPDISLGFQIARRLLGKILIDLRNTREEAISVAEVKKKQDQNSETSELERMDSKSKLHINHEDHLRSGSRSDISVDHDDDDDDDDDKEIQYRLDPK